MLHSHPKKINNTRSTAILVSMTLFLNRKRNKLLRFPYLGSIVWHKLLFFSCVVISDLHFFKYIVLSNPYFEFSKNSVLFFMEKVRTSYMWAHPHWAFVTSISDELPQEFSPISYTLVCIFINFSFVSFSNVFLSFKNYLAKL